MFPWGIRKHFYPNHFQKNCRINCVTYEENTRQRYNGHSNLFRALALLLQGNQRLEEEISSSLILFINKMDGLSTDQFQAVHMNDFPIVDDLLTLSILLCDIDIVDGNITAEIARRKVQKYKNTKQLLRYNKHICYLKNINAVFQSFCCPNCDTFFNRTSNLERHITTYVREWKMSIRRDVWQAGLFWNWIH